MKSLRKEKREREGVEKRTHLLFWLAFSLSISMAFFFFSKKGKREKKKEKRKKPAAEVLARRGKKEKVSFAIKGKGKKAPKLMAARAIFSVFL